MAHAVLLKPFILRWEGGFVVDPLDKGGATNKGITISTFKYHFGQERTVEELKELTDDQWLYIFKVGYWNAWKADEIENQSIANIVVDWAWASGPKTSIKQVQRILNVADDGIVGKKTLSALNGSAPGPLFEEIKKARLFFVQNIVDRNLTQVRFLNDWCNRIKAISFEG